MNDVSRNPTHKELRQEVIRLRAKVEKQEKQIKNLKQLNIDACEFEDTLVKLLNVSDRTSDHDDTDNGRIISRCEELLKQLAAMRTALAVADAALEKIEYTPHGWDGDCGTTKLAANARAAIRRELDGV